MLSRLKYNSELPLYKRFNQNSSRRVKALNKTSLFKAQAFMSSQMSTFEESQGPLETFCMKCGKQFVGEIQPNFGQQTGQLMKICFCNLKLKPLKIKKERNQNDRAEKNMKKCFM